MVERKGGLTAGVRATQPKAVEALAEMREATGPDVSAMIQQHRDIAHIEPRPPVASDHPLPANLMIAAPTTRENMKRITMIVADDFHHKLKQLALDKRSTLEDLYREALGDLMTKYGRE